MLLLGSGDRGHDQQCARAPGAPAEAAWARELVGRRCMCVMCACRCSLPLLFDGALCLLTRSTVNLTSQVALLQRSPWVSGSVSATR